MAYRNNYDDLLRDIQASGQSWSTYDLELAKGNPDAGRSIYTQKLAYANAQTDAERQAANDAAEMIRQQYGGYTGGKTGAGFTLTGKNTANQAAPSYTQYASKYQTQIDDLMAQLSGRPAFSYKPTDDPSYAAFSEHYRNAGNQAREDTLAQAAAMVGGQPSSYAVAAAQQAQNAYNAQMSDIIPQLRDAAYGMYVDEGNAMRDDLSMLMAMDEAAYNRHQNEYANQMAEWEANYGASRDAIEDARYDQEWDLALRQAAAKAAGGKEDTIDFKVAMAMAEQGVFTDEVLKAFYEAGYNDEYLTRVYGYEPPKDLTLNLTNNDYMSINESVEFLRGLGLDSSQTTDVMDQAQWEKQKLYGSSKAEVAYYDTYRDYLYAYAQYRLALDSGMLSAPVNKSAAAGGGGVNRNELR